ncbi:Mth938-like domain-containing protein [Nitrospirota bacterium]
MKIDNYKFGSIVINGATYTTDIIIYPDRVQDSWWRKEGHRLGIIDINEIIQASPELIIVGTGAMGIMRVPEETASYIRSHKIEILTARTPKAVELYNDNSTQRKTIAALHLTC